MNQSIQGFERCSLGVYLKTSNSTTTIATGWQIHKRDVETFRYQKNFPEKLFPENEVLVMSLVFPKILQSYLVRIGLFSTPSQAAFPPGGVKILGHRSS